MVWRGVGRASRRGCKTLVSWLREAYVNARSCRRSEHLMTLTDTVFQRLLVELNTSASRDHQLSGALRLLAKWRSTLIQNTVVQKFGTVVLEGPFKGMQFLAQSTEGCHVP